MRHTLAIETSCDDTSVAILRDDGFVVSMIAQNQDARHAPFGGIVPEIAGRAHAENLLTQIDNVVVGSGVGWNAIHGIAVTCEPGLIGSLLVGVVTAKSLALCKNLPLIGVNHIEGHLFAGFVRDSSYEPPADFGPAFLALAVSGGHTSLVQVHGLGEYILLGATSDDAAGEALDKFAKLLGFGFPGGAQVDSRASRGDPSKFQFPRGREHEKSFNFSFSGLKSSAARLIRSLSDDELQRSRADLCASYQTAVVDVLLAKLESALIHTQLKCCVVTGGVSANSELRRRVAELCESLGVKLMLPPLRYCTDNAAMIGFVGSKRLARGERSSMDLAPSPVSHLELTRRVKNELS